MTHQLDLSVVVASLDSQEMLGRSLGEWLKLPIRELIVVDGGSVDGSLELLERLAESDSRLSFTTDTRPGLSIARNAGTKLATSRIILHAGPDNTLPADTLHAMVAALDTSSLVSCRTLVASGQRYRDMVLNVSKSRLAAGGDLDVVGTPYLGLRNLFILHPFNESVRDSDDTFFCAEIRSHGNTIARLDSVCFEGGFETISSLKSRYVRWGRSDAEYYSFRSRNMSFFEKIRSFTRAFWVEAFTPARYSRIDHYLASLPFLLYFGYLRFRAFRDALKALAMSHRPMS